MTVQEANRDALGRCKMRGCNLCDSYRKELEQYRALGTVEELKNAREKQVAKNIIRQKGECYAKTIDGKEYHEQILVCPNCHRAIKRTEALDVHCKYCGQALKWEEEDD